MNVNSLDNDHETSFEDIMPEIITDIIVSTLRPIRRTRVITKLYPFMLTNRYFYKVCTSKYMAMRIVPIAIYREHIHTDPADLIEQYHRPVITIDNIENTTNTPKIFICKLDNSIKKVKRIISQELWIPPHRTVVIHNKDPIKDESGDPFAMIAGKNFLKNHSGGGWEIIIRRKMPALVPDNTTGILSGINNNQQIVQLGETNVNVEVDAATEAAKNAADLLQNTDTRQ